MVAPAAAERSDQSRKWPRCCISSQVWRLGRSIRWRNGTHSLCTHQRARVLRQKRTIWHVCCCGACDLRTACPWFRQWGSDRLRTSRFEAESQGSTPHQRCRLQCPESTYPPPPPNISTPVSWKYAHNRWNMHNSVFSTETTKLNGLLICWIFHPALSYPQK